MGERKRTGERTVGPDGRSVCRSIGRSGARIKIGGCAFVRFALPFFFPSRSIPGRPVAVLCFRSSLCITFVRFCTRNHVDHPAAVTRFLLARPEYSSGIREIRFNCATPLLLCISYRISCHVRRVRSYHNYFVHPSELIRLLHLSRVCRDFTIAQCFHNIFFLLIKYIIFNLETPNNIVSFVSGKKQ